MTLLVDRVRRIEQIKYKKERNRKFDKNKRDKIAYVETYKDNDNAIKYQDLDFNKEKDEICMAELQPGPLYTCQMLKLEGKHKFSNSKYSLNVTKADKIFNLLLKDKQMTFSDDHKIPSF